MTNNLFITALELPFITLWESNSTTHLMAKVLIVTVVAAQFLSNYFSYDLRMGGKTIELVVRKIP